MPTPTREQFNAAAKKVAQSAPDGLSREEFFKLVDRELSGVSSPSALDMASGKVGRDSTYDNPSGEKEPDTWTGGFVRGLRREFVDPLLKSPAAQGAAHPQTATDMAGLLIPSLIGMGSAREFIPAAKNLYEGAAQGAADREGLKKVPAVIKGMWNRATVERPEVMLSKAERKWMSEGHQTPDVSSVPDRGVPQGWMPKSTLSDVEQFKPNVSGRDGTTMVGGPEGVRPTEGMPQGDMPNSVLSQVDRHMPNRSGVPDRGVPQELMPRSVLSEIDQFHPNTSGVPDHGIPQGEMPQSTASMVDRNHPNVSGVPDRGVDWGEMPQGTQPIEMETAQDRLARGSGPQGSPIQTDRVPYGGDSPHSPSEPAGKLTGEKAPSLEDILQSVIQEQLGKGEPAGVSTLSETGPVAGAQKPKLGKRPGGYTTDLPPVTPQDAEAIAQKTDAARAATPAPVSETTGKASKMADVQDGTDSLEQLMSATHPGEDIPRVNEMGHGTAGSSYADTMKSIEPEFDRNVHTGADPGTPEAKSAAAHHKMFGEMDADYQRRIADEKGQAPVDLQAVLTALLGGGAAAAPLISRAITPNASEP